jgi:glycosyltransferase involved in cell wall biosynthesis
MSTNCGLSVGWILVGDRKYGSARIHGYNVHNYLLGRDVDSVVLRAPKIASQCLSFGVLDYIRLIFAGRNIIIFQKVFDDDAIRLAKWLRMVNIRTVLVLCDLQHTAMINIVDCVIVTSSFLADFISREYRVEAVVIDDAIEVPCTTMPTSPENQRPRAVWVGNKDNWGTIERLQDLIRRFGLNKKFDLVTVSDHPDARVYWSEQNALLECLRADFALLPTDNTPWAMAKSSNRMSMFLSLGLPVLAETIPSYLTLAQKTGGVKFIATDEEWVDNLCLMCDDGYRRRLIGDAAARVRAILDMSVIGERWIGVLQGVVNRNKSTFG